MIKYSFSIDNFNPMFRCVYMSDINEPR